MSLNQRIHHIAAAEAAVPQTAWDDNFLEIDRRPSPLVPFTSRMS